MGVRAECTHIATESGQTIKVELIGASYAGASRELIGTGANWCALSYDQLDYTDLFNTVVQRARLDFSYYVQDATDEAILDEIIASGQGEYTLKLYINGSQYWIGEVMLDQLGAQEEGRAYPYAVRLTAKDFTNLDRGLFPLEDSRQTIAKIAGRILFQTGYALPIWTHTSWTEANMTATNDFMRQTYADTRNLREFDKSGDLQITYLEALTRILTPFRAIVRQELGVFTITQWSEYETPSAVLRTVYDSDGDYVSQSDVNTSVSANATVKVVQGSLSEFKPGYKRVNASYAHRTPVSGIQVPDVVTLDELTTSELFEQVIEINATDINQRISINSTAFVNFDDPQLGSVIVTEPKVGVILALTIEGVTSYWNHSSQAWQSGTVTNQFETRSTTKPFRVADFPDIEFESFVASIAITTTSLTFVNNGLTGFGTIALTLVRATTTRDSETVYEGTSLVVGSDNNENVSQSLGYTLTQNGSFSTNYNAGSYYFGSGPLTSSPGALRYGTGDLDVVGLWGRRGGSNEYLFHVQNLKEIMDLYRGWNKVITAIVKNVGYDTTKTLVYNSGNYNAIGGMFDGYRGWWTALAFDNNLVTSALDNIDLGIIGGNRQLIAGAYTAARLNSQNALEQSGGYSFRLGLDASGTITQLFVQNTLTEYPLLQATAQIRVVHPITLEDYIFVVSEDMTEGSLIIPVVSQTITDTIPAGSFVYTNPGDASSALIIGRDAIRAVARSRAVGVLRSAVDGVVTTLDVVMYEPVRDGQDFVVFNPNTLVEYNITINGSFNVVDTTITIQEQLVIAPVGAYVTGSESYKQAELIITPSQVQTRVIRTENAVSLGDLNAEIGAGPGIVSLPLENTAVGTTVLNDTVVVVKRFDGQVEEFVVDGEQTINADPFTLTVDSKTTTLDLDVGDAVEQPSFNATGQIAVQAGTVVLKAVANGGGTEIESLALVRLDATPVGSSILLQADQITVDGQTTFLNSLAENGFTSIADNNVVIYSATAPTTREDASPLVAGDVWRETDENDRPYVRSGSSWLRGFTVIDGGTITTGTVDTDRLNVSNIITVGSISTEAYADGVASSEATTARDEARNNIALRLGYTDYDTMVSDATADGTIIDGGFIRTSLIEVDNLFAVNASITATLTLGVGGEFVFTGGKLNNDGIAFNYATAINPDQSIQWLRDAPDGGGWGAYVQGIDEGGGYYSLNLNARSGVNIGAGLGLTGGDVIQIGVNGSKSIGVTVYGNTTFSGKIDVGDEIRVFGGLHVYDADESHYANIVYGASNEDTTLNIPTNTTGSTVTRTVALKEIDNSFSVNQTVPNATANGHALNRITADGRYGRLASANTWTLAQTFVNEITINDEIRMGTAGANRPIVFATQDGGSNDITVSLTAQNGGTAGNKTVTIPNKTGTLGLINSSQSWSATQTYSGTLNVTGTMEFGGSTGQAWTVRLIDADSNQYDVVFTKGGLTSVTAV